MTDAPRPLDKKRSRAFRFSAGCQLECQGVACTCCASTALTSLSFTFPSVGVVISHVLEPKALGALSCPAAERFVEISLILLRSA